MCDNAQLLPELQIVCDPLFPPVTYLQRHEVKACWGSAYMAYTHNGNEGWLQTQFQLDDDILKTLSLPLSSSSKRDGAGVGEPME
jgi:hypothetical protein